MTRRRSIFAILSVVVLAIASQALRHVTLAQDASQPGAEPRSPFRVLDVYVDSGASSLAAYQFEFNTTQKNTGELKLVGIEGGESTAFKEPPRYDPRALAMPGPRVIVAAFNTGKDLPTGKTRVARLMIRVAPGAEIPRELEGHLTAAATADAKPIAGATLQIVEGAME
jgi:hypothetical protein